jgi:hypothetical protein
MKPSSIKWQRRILADDPQVLSRYFLTPTGQLIAEPNVEISIDTEKSIEPTATESEPKALE